MDNILSIVTKIKGSRDIWRVTHGVSWKLYNQLTKYKNTPNWKRKVIKITLPQSEKVHFIYTPYELHNLLDRDYDIILLHLVTLLSLFEELLKESWETLCKKRLPNRKNSVIKPFFQFKDTQDMLDNTQLKQLNLARLTRNIYIHNSSKENKDWIKGYKETGETKNISLGDSLNNIFPEPEMFLQVEKWNELIIKISDKIKDKLERI